MTDWSPLDIIAYDEKWQPYSGWHDDQTDVYQPAIQQNRAEFHELAQALRFQGLRGKCLQLGLGTPGAAHQCFKTMFEYVWTVDCNSVQGYYAKYGYDPTVIEDNTHNPDLLYRLRRFGVADLDLLFIDAGHLLHEVRNDFDLYNGLVKTGGMIAFHDAFGRHPGIEVPQFLDELYSRGLHTSIIGQELGIAYLYKE